MNTIISKRPDSVEVTEWASMNEGNVKARIRSVTIFGGAGVFDSKALVTPEGVATEVSDEALEWLKKQAFFVKQCDRGMFRIIEHKSAKTIDADEIASSGKMEKDENIPGRPLTPEQLKKDGAVINSDGSVDLSNGGKNAPSKSEQHIVNYKRERAIAKRAGKKK